ncbi:hypothetical protein GCM10011607_13610 [Shewanella inventionis]|uniref:Uncharacterized protein n=1 Tax=Shewanella inventionis TaxID=1738770 RepID=A0ABQ1IWK3_9GAMM|nr:hypothetical protein GCM10011607_13610 [Shewanella inventionis]
MGSKPYLGDKNTQYVNTVNEIPNISNDILYIVGRIINKLINTMLYFV